MDMKGLTLAMASAVMAICITISTSQEATNTCIGQLDLVYMVDASNSVRDDNFKAQMDSLAQLTSKLNVDPNGIRVGIVVFSSTIISKPISGNKADVLYAIPRFEYLDESTRTDLGLQEALKLFRQSDRGSEVPRLLMVVTDGASTQPIETQKAVSQLKAEGISIYAIGISDAISESELRQLATSINQVMITPDFRNISRVLEDAVHQACTAVIVTTPTPTLPPSVANHLCSKSGSLDGSIGFVRHPTDCDKYVQCYYNSVTDFHLGVVRHCPIGLFWDESDRSCQVPEKVRCDRDPCTTDCAPYPMTGSSRAYWVCENKMSKAMCCGEFQSFVQGKGCVNNTMCKESCVIGDCGRAGQCQRRPKWNSPAMSEVQLAGGYLGWYPQPCSYHNFDIIDCKCSSPKDQLCFPDFETTFNSAASLGQFVTAHDVSFNAFGAMVGDGRSLHFDLHKRLANEPLTVKVQFRQDYQSDWDSNILMASNHDCPYISGSLLITFNLLEVRATIETMDKQSAVVAVPILGFNNYDMKEVAFSYDNEYFIMRVVIGNAEFVEKVKAPKGVAFPCGIDIGATKEHTGFKGTVQRLSIYSCSLPSFY